MTKHTFITSSLSWLLLYQNHLPLGKYISYLLITHNSNLKVLGAGFIRYIYLLCHSFTHDTSLTWLPKQDINKYSTHRTADMGDGISQGPNLGSYGIMRVGTFSFLGMSLLIGYPIPISHLWNWWHQSNCVFIFICACVCVWVWARQQYK